MFDVIATGDYYADLGIVADDRSPANLKAMTLDLCRERFRRIDRFTQLALIGSARCVADTSLPAATGLYIGSGMGAVGNTIAVHEHLFVRHKIPKPADFINTLSNSAGYYVARNLGLTAQNIFVSRRAASMEAAFEMAALELATGAIEMALIGLVDECTSPARHHAQRLHRDGRAALAEGSHWFLVRPASPSGRLGRVLDARTVVGVGALQDWLGAAAGHPGALLSTPPEFDTGALGGFASMPRFEPAIGDYLSRGAGVLLRYFGSDRAEPLVMVGCDQSDRFHVTRAIKHR